MRIDLDLQKLVPAAKKKKPQNKTLQKLTPFSQIKNSAAITLHCARAPSLFVAVSEVKMSRQTTLGRFGFKKSISHRNSVMEMKVPDFVSTMSRTIKYNHCSKLFVNQQGLSVLVGRKVTALYENGWFTGIIVYFNRELK